MRNLTLKDFKKRTNKAISWMFNYEYREGDFIYSIYRMEPNSLKISIEQKAFGGGFWKTIEPKEIKDIDEGIEIICNFRKRGIR